MGRVRRRHGCGWPAALLVGEAVVDVLVMSLVGPHDQDTSRSVGWQLPVLLGDRRRCHAFRAAVVQLLEECAATDANAGKELGLGVDAAENREDQRLRKLTKRKSVLLQSVGVTKRDYTFSIMAYTGASTDSSTD